MKIKRKKRPSEVNQPLIDDNNCENSSSDNKSVGLFNLNFVAFDRS
jgi:hypothetical protein